MSWIITGTQKLDPDAAFYIDRVEAADGQSLEEGVKLAYSTFVSGCKTDGIWDAIKACCILAGARTTNGALVPLVGDAPTPYNFDLVGDTDYNRVTGLKGDGSTKYLNSNRNNNTDPQNNIHTSVYVTAKGTGATGGLMDAGSSPGPTNIYYTSSGVEVGTRSRSIGFDNTSGLNGNWLGLIGQSRSTSSGYTRRVNGVNADITRASAAPDSGNHIVFSSANARLSFYSIGESLDLAALDTRVSNLMTAIGAAIP